ncbi:hypothetical protein KEM55_007704 [Ascosphaera atra]|nr:hypothetical protein KEM55_007704 [Ascosphaera atra]
MASAKESSPAPDRVFTAAERIQQLNEIDKDVTKLLSSASSAIGTLTKASPSDKDASTPDTLENRKAAFTSATSEYLALLSSVDVRLRRQVYALEEASIVTSETTKDEAAVSANTGAGDTAGRLGTVDRTKEAELWAEARRFAEEHFKDATGTEKQGDAA